MNSRMYMESVKNLLPSYNLWYGDMESMVYTWLNKKMIAIGRLQIASAQNKT